MSDTEIEAVTAQVESTQQPPMAEFVAMSPYELTTAHSGMAKWAEAKCAEMLALVDECREALEAAVEHKWRQGSFKRQLHQATQRYEFYLKIKKALELGYLVVPNFPMGVFAVRTSLRRPTGTETSMWGRPTPTPASARLLPSGVGKFVAASTTGKVWTEEVTDPKTEDKRTKHLVEATDFKDPSADFPIALAKPQVISATSRALAERLFDEMGVANDSGGGGQRRGDPIVLGRILNPRRSAPSVTFFLAWVTDMRRV